MRVMNWLFEQVCRGLDLLLDMTEATLDWFLTDLELLADALMGRKDEN